jgi:hypothetical protein
MLSACSASAITFICGSRHYEATPSFSKASSHHELEHSRLLSTATPLFMGECGATGYRWRLLMQTVTVGRLHAHAEHDSDWRVPSVLARQAALTVCSASRSLTLHPFHGSSPPRVRPHACACRNSPFGAVRQRQRSARLALVALVCYSVSQHMLRPPCPLCPTRAARPGRGVHF